MTPGDLELKVLNKWDMADPESTESWLAPYRAVPGKKPPALDAGAAAPLRQLFAACRLPRPHAGEEARRHV